MTNELKAPTADSKLWSVIHHNKFGDTVWLVWSETEPTEEQIIHSVLDAEYDEDDDGMTIHSQRLSDIKKILP